MADTIVVLGGGLCGGTAAAVLRDQGFDGRIVIVCAEQHLPYERPPLSKEYLRGEAAFERALVRPPEFWAEKSIETRLGVRAERLEPAARKVHLDDGTDLSYDAILIATGARNRRFPIPGIDLPGIYDLRTREDCDRIRSEAGPGRRAAIIGMGFIGSEAAASLKALGAEVTVIEGLQAPLARVLGDDIGQAIAGLHRENGIDMRFGEMVQRFEGTERVEAVVTASGLRVPCDFALVAVGVEPNVELARDAGLEVENGIKTDERCRTSAEDVYAAGDVASAYHPVFDRNIRVEHWQNAMKQGEAAAKSMLGQDVVYDEVPWFWSDQYDANLQYAGFHTEWDELVVRGSIESRDFVAFYLKEGRVLACVGMNRGREVRRSIPLIKAGRRVYTADLRNESLDLRTLAGS